MRVKFLKNWDKALTWTLSTKNRDFILKNPIQKKDFSVQSPDFFIFNENYGYFSILHPIVGIVTKEVRDIEVTNCLLMSIYEQIKDKEQYQLTADEILVKIMAYRNLELGMKISVPVVNMQGESVLETYLVDEIIDLWRGMPAFGLIPMKGTSPSILLFRGTDLTFTSEKGWASMISDLDITGPGFKTFLRAKDQIQGWLKKVSRREIPARAIGFSLGGAFVFYTMIHFPDLLHPHFPSKAFNPPGIKNTVLTKWEQSAGEKPPYIVYVNQGDVVSKMGFLPSNVWEISIKQPMEVIQAHVTIMSLEPSYLMREVDIDAENKMHK